MNFPVSPRLSKLDPSAGASLNLTPLIDVVLLLLIFFMLTSPLVMQTAAPEITPPETRTPRAISGEGHRIAIDAADAVTLDGEAVTLSALEERMPALRPRVTILADAAASLGVTMKVMDACRAHDVAADIYATPVE